MSTPLAHTRRRHPALQPGITLLEVLLAVVLLTLVASAMFASMGAIDTMENRARLNTSAFEVANRLMLQYLDDEKKLPSKVEALDYGPYSFMYDVSESRVKMGLNAAQLSGGSAPQGLERFRQITVTVFEADVAGPYPVKGEAIALLDRIVDPSAPRNPETIDNLARGGNDAVGTFMQKVLQGIVPEGATVPQSPKSPTQK